ncbi:hypothetical protein [Sulfurimonas sp.]|uniref:hypothetical protein n=1 Tax=Sulfurimonas sp. TaxID=2022749 RepID=UPI003563E455
MEKLEFISNEISNLIVLKQHLESNISQIVKFYGLTLAAFFAFIVFYEGKDLEYKFIYAYMGICFIIFTSATTYYTAHTISKNLKRRILYRREIVSLRKIANDMMDNAYCHNIVCQLENSKMSFSKFNSLPTIAIFMGTAIPILFYKFSKDLLVAYEVLDSLNINANESIVSISMSALVTLFALVIMLNLYTHHRREMIIAEKVNISQDERTVKDRVDCLNKKRRNRKKYKLFRMLARRFVIAFVVIILIQFFSNIFIPKGYFIFLEFILIALIVLFLVKKNRVINMRKSRVGEPFKVPCIT